METPSLERVSIPPQLLSIIFDFFPLPLPLIEALSRRLGELNVRYCLISIPGEDPYQWDAPHIRVFTSAAIDELHLFPSPRLEAPLSHRAQQVEWMRDITHLSIKPGRYITCVRFRGDGSPSVRYYIGGHIPHTKLGLLKDIPHLQGVSLDWRGGELDIDLSSLSSQCLTIYLPNRARDIYVRAPSHLRTINQHGAGEDMAMRITFTERVDLSWVPPYQEGASPITIKGVDHLDMSRDGDESMDEDEDEDDGYPWTIGVTPSMGDTSM